MTDQQTDLNSGADGGDLPEQYPVVQTDYKKVAVSADVAAGTVERLRTHWLAAVAADQKLAEKGEGLQVGFGCMSGRRLSHTASALISQVCAHRIGEGLLWHKFTGTEYATQKLVAYTLAKVSRGRLTPHTPRDLEHQGLRFATAFLPIRHVNPRRQVWVHSNTLSGHVILRFMSVSEDKPLTRLLLGQTQI